jgi:hypothetical protein
VALPLNYTFICRVFFYFVDTAYKQGRTSSFISLEKSSGDCTEVPFSVFGEFYGDMRGNWYTNVKFSDIDATFKAGFHGFEATRPQYAETIKALAADLKRVGDTGSHRDLVWNLVAMSMYSYTSRKYGTFKFFAAGNIRIIMNQRDNLVGASNGSVMCYPGATYDPTSGVVTIQYSYPDAQESCKALASTLGYNPFYGDDFVFNVDLKAVATAVAVNYGIIPLTELTQINDDYQYDYDSPVTAAAAAAVSSEDRVRSEEVSLDGTATREKDIQGVMDKGRQNVRQTMKKTRAAAPVTIDLPSPDAFRRSLEDVGPDIVLNRYVDTLRFVDEPLSSSPVFCVRYEDDDVNAACALFKSDEALESIVIIYPVLKHWIPTNCYDDSVWGPGWYNSRPETGIDWTGRYDNYFDILMGLIVFTDSSEAMDFAIEAINYRRDDPINGDLVIPDRVHSALFNVTQSIPFDPATVCGISSVTGKPRNCFLLGYDTYGEPLSRVSIMILHA